jgi:glutamine amidotransferase
VKPKITVVDYGAGNLRSVVNAIQHLGYESELTNSATALKNAQAVIFPGQGTAGETMKNLKKVGLIDPLRDYVAAGRPFFGVCLGLQVLLTETDEDGGVECLDFVRGKVHKLPSGVKIPHMGWNQVKQKMTHPVFEGIPDESNFYFVHSYYVAPEDKSLVAGETDYNITFCSMIAKGNLVATQFHPEKSGELGLKMYDNFIKMAVGAGTGNTKH